MEAKEAYHANAEKVGQVSERINALEKVASEYNDLIIELEGTLVTITTTTPVGIDSAEAKEERVLVPLAANIKAISETLSNLNDQLRHIITSVEL